MMARCAERRTFICCRFGCRLDNDDLYGRSEFKAFAHSSIEKLQARPSPSSVVETALPTPGHIYTARHMAHGSIHLAWHRSLFRQYWPPTCYQKNWQPKCHSIGKSARISFVFCILPRICDTGAVGSRSLISEPAGFEAIIVCSSQYPHCQIEATLGSRSVGGRSRVIHI